MFCNWAIVYGDGEYFVCINQTSNKKVKKNISNILIYKYKLEKIIALFDLHLSVANKYLETYLITFVHLSCIICWKQVFFRCNLIKRAEYWISLSWNSQLTYPYTSKHLISFQRNWFFHPKLYMHVKIFLPITMVSSMRLRYDD